MRLYTFIVDGKTDANNLEVRKKRQRRFDVGQMAVEFGGE